MKQKHIKKRLSILKYFNIFYFIKKIKWISGKIPILICILFFLLSLIPINNFFITQKPPFFLLPFFYWMTKRPENMGLLYILIIAFMYDVLDNNFFGINIFLIMIIYSFLLYQKFIPINKNYITHYITFALVTIFYYATKYTMYVFMSDVKLNPLYIILNYLVILTLYPVVYKMMGKINKQIE